MQVPSGIRYTRADLGLIKQMQHYRFIEFLDEPVPLNSGISTRVYVNGRDDVTDHPEFLWKLGQRIVKFVYDHSTDWRQPCLIGIPAAGNNLVAAAVLTNFCKSKQSLRRRHPHPVFAGGRVPMICYRQMREVPKDHGPHEGMSVIGRPDFQNHFYWGLENAATSGKGIIEAADRMERDGYPSRTMPLLILVDRQQGALARLKQAGFQRVHVMFNLLDILHAIGELKLWPMDQVRAAQEDIRANQFR